MTNKRLLFVYTRLSTFVRCDLGILEKEYQVSTFCVDNTTRGKQLLSMFRLLFYLIFNINRFKIVYIWFADYHSFLPVLFAKLCGKRSYVVIGGYDVCRIRNLKYGSFSNPVRGFMTKFSMSNATLTLCVSKHVARIVKAIAPKSKREVLYNGVAFSTVVRPGSDGRDCCGEKLSVAGVSKEGFVLSVALSSSRQSYYIKGVDRYIEAARTASDLKFVAVGLDKNALSNLIGEVPDNLEIISRLSQEELSEYYSKASVYCQLSRSESFGVALAEAMYYNCVPVITNTGGMPEVTGDLGFIVSGKETCDTVAAIRSALTLPPSDKYQTRVVEQFTITARAYSLIRILGLSCQSN